MVRPERLNCNGNIKVIPDDMPEAVLSADRPAKIPGREGAGRALARRAAAGDREAFAQLVGEHYDFIFAIAYKWLGVREDAEDVAQDVCIKLARIVGTYDGRAAFSTWLYRVVLNGVHDLQRFRMRQSRQARELKETALSQMEPGQEHSVMQREIWAAVRALPDRQRDAMLLVYGEGKSHAEAAAIMECREVTVSGHIHAAKKKLKKLL